MLAIWLNGVWSYNGFRTETLPKGGSTPAESIP
jgi:hypothetical protein